MHLGGPEGPDRRCVLTQNNIIYFSTEGCTSNAWFVHQCTPRCTGAEAGHGTVREGRGRDAKGEEMRGREGLGAF